MANKKINQLDSRVLSATDLMLVGDPITGTSYKSLVSGLGLVYVPYTGATTNVDLGEYELKAGQLTLDVSPTGTAAVGTTRWNNTLGSSETTLKGGSVVLKNGVDLVARIVNKVTPNATLTKAAYQAVRVSGAQGQRLAVAYAQANSDNNSADTIGLVTETIATNQEGFIITVGQIEGINTTGSLQGETWADGDVLYLSPTTAGAITNIKPVAPGHIVVIGYVEYAHAINGKIYVKTMNGWELDELHNVAISSPANNEALIYESSTSLWKNKTIATALGYTPQAALTLTTTGTSGAATLVGATLNIPQYSGGGGTTIYSGDGTLAGNRVVTMGANTLNFYGSNYVSFTHDNTRTLSLATSNSGSFIQAFSNFGTSAKGKMILNWDGGQVVIGGLSTENASNNVKIFNGFEVEAGGGQSLLFTNSNSSDPTINVRRAVSNINNGVGYKFSLYNSSSAFVEYATIYGSIATNTAGSHSGYLQFVTTTSGTATEKMRLTSAGRLLLGTTTESTYIFDAVGTARITGDAVVNGLTVGKGGGNVSSNTALGGSALISNTTGFDNCAFGSSSARNLTTGLFCSAFGSGALYTFITGNHNSAFGYVSLFSSVGSRNSAFGSASLYSLSSGNDNTALGNNAGRYIAGGVTANTTSGSSIFIGSDTKALADNQTNQIVIGYNTTGLGSNTTVIGNSSTTDTAIYGRMLVNYTSPVIGTYALDVNGTARVSGQITGGSASLDGQTTAGTSLGVKWFTISGSSGRYIYNASTNSDLLAFNNGIFALQGSGVTSFTIGSFGISATGSGNIAILGGGTGAGSNNVTVGYTASGALTTGSNNVAIGQASLYNVTTNSDNVAIGRYAGTSSGSNSNANHSQSIFIGSGTGWLSGGTALTNTTIIGYSLRTNLSNVFMLGRSDQTIMVGEGTSVGSGAILQIDSTTKGFLPPRGTNTQMLAIASPAEGLCFYDTTNHKLNVYDGTTWQACW